MPRWTLAALEVVHAGVLVAAGAVLPFRGWTVFALGCFAQAALHAVVALLAIAGHPRRALAWRVQSFASIGVLAVLTVALLRSGLYVASVYESLGRGVGAAMLAGWAVAVLFTVPLACWGIAATGGIRWRRRTPQLLLLVAGAAAFGAGAQARASAAVRATPMAGSDLVAALAPVAAAWKALPIANDPPSLLSRAPVECGAPPGSGLPTWIVTYLSREAKPRSRCLQPPSGDALAAALAEDGARGPVVVDQIEAAQRIPWLSTVLEALALRPGLDGVCLGARCLMPWQLVAGGQFGRYRPLPDVPDLRFGVRAASVRDALGDPGPSLRGLDRVVTRTAVIDAQGDVRPLLRQRRPDPPTDGAGLADAARAAEGFVLAAQVPDGRFLYSLDPFTGVASFEGFAIARQAGTTAALCELGGASPRIRSAAASALALLATLEWQAGEIGALVPATDGPAAAAKLGPSALGLVALLSCRPRFGRRYDDLIGRLARFVLLMQTDEGGFHPELDRSTARPRPGPPPMYAEGEAVLALVLLEDAATRQRSARLPRATEVGEALDRAMGHFGRRYWTHLERDLFFFEESWHCIAARAALARHRNPDYERLCIDYVAFKSRFVLGPESEVAPELEGGLGFGNIVPPQSTPTASFGEAVAAAIQIKLARGEDVGRERATLARILAFLSRQQWDKASCFACSSSVVVPGAFSEMVSSPTIRIDFVQHAWAAIAHGAKALGP